MKRNNNTKLRKNDILKAALAVAERTHYAQMTRQEVADEAGVTGPLVQHYFGTMGQLRKDVMRHAVLNRVLPVIVQGLVAKDKQALKASQELKAAALAGVLLDD